MTDGLLQKEGQNEPVVTNEQSKSSRQNLGAVGTALGQ